MQLLADQSACRLVNWVLSTAGPALMLVMPDMTLQPHHTWHTSLSRLVTSWLQSSHMSYIEMTIADRQMSHLLCVHHLHAHHHTRLQSQGDSAWPYPWMCHTQAWLPDQFMNCQETQLAQVYTWVASLSSCLDLRCASYVIYILISVYNSTVM